MESVVNIHEAKTHFSKLIERIQRGEDVVIAKAGVPVARLTAYTAPRSRIGTPGGMQGEGFWVASDFDTALPDELTAAFEGRD